MTEICEVAGVREGEVVLNPLFIFQEDGEQDGKIIGRLKRTGNELMYTDKLKMAGMGLSGMRFEGDRGEE
ncbi:hypothetical protein D3C73_1363490 [compost metagenome]